MCVCVLRFRTFLYTHTCICVYCPCAHVTYTHTLSLTHTHMSSHNAGWQRRSSLVPKSSWILRGRANLASGPEGSFTPCSKMRPRSTVTMTLTQRPAVRVCVCVCEHVLCISCNADTDTETETDRHRHRQTQTQRQRQRQRYTHIHTYEGARPPLFGLIQTLLQLHVEGRKSKTHRRRQTQNHSCQDSLAAEPVPVQTQPDGGGYVDWRDSLK